METINWGYVIGVATLIATIIIGVKQYYKKDKSRKSAKVFGFGDAVNGDKIGTQINIEKKK